MEEPKRIRVTPDMTGDVLGSARNSRVPWLLLAYRGTKEEVFALVFRCERCKKTEEQYLEYDLQAQLQRAEAEHKDCKSS